MGRGIRSLPRVDRAELDGKPMGLQRDGDHDLDRRLFVVHLFHSTKSDLRRPQMLRASTDIREPG